MIPITARLYLGTPSGDELVGNPGFETAGTGGPDVWDVWHEGSAIDEGVIVHGGAHAAELGAGCYLFQSDIDFNAGNVYRLTFWTRSMDGLHAGTFKVEVQSSDFCDADMIPETTSGVPGTTYAQVTAYFVARSVKQDVMATEHVYLWFYGGRGGCYVDDVSLVDMGDYDYAELTDAVGPVEWEGGFLSYRPLDRVAGTGSMGFTLDNSAANSGGLWGLYSPGHVNCLSGFELGAPVYLSLDDGGGEEIVFRGWIADIEPDSGMYQSAMCRVTVQDALAAFSNMEFPLMAAYQNTSEHDIGFFITGALNDTTWPVTAASDGNCKEILPVVYDTEVKGSSFMAFLQKMALHEMGRIYVEPGALNLVVEGRDTRPMNRTPAFVLTDAVDRPVSELGVLHARYNRTNIVEATVYPYDTDAAATTHLYALTGNVRIDEGETVTLDCPFTDPVTGKPIAATDVVDPVTDFELGSKNDMVSDNYHAYLTQTNELGATRMVCTIGYSKRGIGRLYLNDWVIEGRGIYRGDGVTMTATDEVSLAVNGPTRMRFRLQQIADSNVGQRFADFVLIQANRDGCDGLTLSFCANRDATIAAAALLIKPSQRFTLAEVLTGVSGDYFIEWYSCVHDGGQILNVTLGATPASMFDDYMKLNAGHLDDVTDGRLYL